jgi:hypothetical protein
MNMLQVCIFVPFLHSETPKPHNVAKSGPRIALNQVPHQALFKEIMDQRDKIGREQNKKRDYVNNLRIDPNNPIVNI